MVTRRNSENRRTIKENTLTIKFIQRSVCFLPLPVCRIRGNEFYKHHAFVKIFTLCIVLMYPFFRFLYKVYSVPPSKDHARNTLMCYIMTIRDHSVKNILVCDDSFAVELEASESPKKGLR